MTISNNIPISEKSESDYISIEKKKDDYIDLFEPELFEIISEDFDKDKVINAIQVINDSLPKVEEENAATALKIKEIISPQDPAHPKVLTQNEQNEIIELLIENAEKKSEELQHIAEKAEQNANIVDYLELPLNLMASGASIAEHMGDSNLLEMVSGSIVAGKFAQSFVGLGFECYAIEKKAQVIKQKQQDLNTLVSKARNISAPDQQEILNLHIGSLEEEIQELKKELRHDIIGTTIKFTKETFGNSAETLDFILSSHLIETQADVLEKLLLTSEALSLVGSLASWGWNCHQSIHAATQLNETTSKIQELKEMKKSLTVDNSHLAYIIDAKLDRLENIKKDFQYQLGLRVTKISAQSLTIAAATKPLLIASGLAVGATANIFFTAAAGTGLILGTGVLSVGTAVFLYRNRYNVEHSIKTVALESQKIYLDAQLRLAEKEFRTYTSRMKELENEQHVIQENLQKHYLSSTVSQNKTSQYVHERMRKQERFAQNSMKKMHSIDNEMNDLNVKVEQKRKEKTRLKRELTTLIDKKKDIHTERLLKNYRKKFKKLDIETLDVIKSVIQSGLEDPVTRSSIKKFILNQGFPLPPNFNVNHVIKYIVGK